VVYRLLTAVRDCAASLRGAARFWQHFGPELDPAAAAPHWSTGRTWLLRVGLAALRRPLPMAADWAWLIDHSIQVGRVKCLVILGLRLRDLPAGRPLRHADLEPIALEPMCPADQHAVAACLERAAARTGVPRVILDDHGADLHGGVELFRRDHPQAVEVYDLKHKAACLLKARLADDERWQRFATLAGQTKFAVQQTELACLAPPSQRSKARFMNVESLVAWGRKTLALVDDPAALQPLGIAAERLQAKLGWLREFRDELAAWSACRGVIAAALEFVRRRGLYVGAGLDLADALPAAGGIAGTLRTALVDFVTRQSARARIGERLPGTTEVLESCFGRLKRLEGDQSKGGFTGLVLSVGALVGRLGVAEVAEALDRVRVRDVAAWCRAKLGDTVQSLRRRAYAGSECATEMG
jgi:hypothetical protein